MSRTPKFGVASGSSPQELARSLNEAASYGLTQISAMSAAPRGQVWAIVQTPPEDNELSDALDELEQHDYVRAHPDPAPPAAEETTQIVSASAGRVVPAAPGTERAFATGDEPEPAKARDPLEPPPKTDGPATRATSPAGVTR